MNPFESQHNFYDDPICKLITDAICDTYHMKRKIQLLRQSKEDMNGVELLNKARIIILSDKKLISIIVEQFSITEKLKELETIRSKILENFKKVCLETEEPTEEDVRGHEELRIEMMEKHQEILLIIRIDELKAILNNNLSSLCRLYEAWRAEPAIEMENFPLPKKPRKLSRSV